MFHPLLSIYIYIIYSIMCINIFYAYACICVFLLCLFTVLCVELVFHSYLVRIGVSLGSFHTDPQKVYLDPIDPELT